MDWFDRLSRLIADTKGLDAERWFAPLSSARLFLPEMLLCLAILALLLVRMVRGARRGDALAVSLAGVLLALAAALPAAQPAAAPPRMELFTGMLVYDGFTVWMRCLLLGFAALLFVLIRLTSVPNRHDAADVCALLLGATLGMCLMASANHLLMVFLAVEMASVPSYVLAGLLKGHRTGSEAALKYSVFGAAAAGVMLYGVSLLAGLAGTAHLPSVAVRLGEQLPHMAAPERTTLALASLMILVGLSFKLSAVPFHFWCPDVFEGACAEVGAFLSVASKAAALALLVRVVVGLAGPPPDSAGVAADQAASGGPIQLAAATAAAPPAANQRGAAEQLDPLRNLLGKLIGLLAVVTCTFGNLAAYGQTNMKRLLAYSTIAHAGYMMMAVPPLLALAGTAPDGAEGAAAALLIYLAVYLFMNLGAFAVVAVVRDQIVSEEIADYGGLIRESPGLAICLAIILFGLVGLPPLSGFIGKFAVFAALADGYARSGQGYLAALLLAGALNTLLSLFYYLRVVKVMTMGEPPAARPAVRVRLFSPAGAYVALITLPTALLILNWNGISSWAETAASSLLTM